MVGDSGNIGMVGFGVVVGQAVPHNVEVERNLEHGFVTTLLHSLVVWTAQLMN